MKMMKYMMCLATAFLALVACSDADDILSAYHSDPNAVHITAEVGKASADGFTRSNPLGDADDQKKFNTDDEISVKADGQDAVTYKFNGTEWIPQDEKFLKWESETMNFTAYYPASYTGGTPTQPTEYTSEASLAAADYMSFSSSVNKPTDNNTLTLNMNRQMARVVVDIVGFNDQYAQNTTVNSVTINGVKAYKHSVDNEDKYYALIVPCEAQDDKEFLSLKVGENNTETLKGIPALEAGKSYTYQLTVGKNKVSVTGITVADWTTGDAISGKTELYAPYVTFTAEREQTFKMTTNGNYDLSNKFQYSVNEGEWKKVVVNEEVSFGGENSTLRLRGTNLNGTATDNNNNSTITFTDASVKVACTGDIRTLLDWKNYTTVDTQNARFSNLFRGCVALTSAPELPATKLADYCYFYMFYNCENLKTAPELPATKLADYCYSQMFFGCTNLNTPPVLPATKLENYCYCNMFNGCENLNTAPALPAETLAQGCYYYMFSGCTNLKTAPELPATTLASDSYSYMFSGCTNLKTVSDLPAETLKDYCYCGMFFGCINLEVAPKLPAKTLAAYCYYYMFSGCTNLKTAPELPASALAINSYYRMFSGCDNLSSVTMLALSEQITNTPDYFNKWLDGAGTRAASRTLKVKDEDAYNALVNYLPGIWQKGAEGTTVLGENSNKIE